MKQQETTFTLTVQFEIKCKDMEELTDIGDNLIDHVLDTFNDDESIVSGTQVIEGDII